MSAPGFEAWRSTGMVAAELLDPTYPTRGASTWFPHGYRLAGAVVRTAAEHLERLGYEELGLPAFVSTKDFQRQAEHIKSFLDRVYLARPAPCDGEQIIKSTVEAQLCAIFSNWCKQGRPMPYRVQSVRAVGRYETGKTAPLWKERVVWPFFEAHAALVGDVNDELAALNRATYAFCSQICLPVIGVERVKVNRRLTEYAHRRLEGITVMPSGRITVLTSIYDLGDRFSRVFDVRAPDWRYPAMANFAFSGRLVLAMLGHCFRERAPIHAPAVAPIQVAVLPTRSDDVLLVREAERLVEVLGQAGVRARAFMDARSFQARQEYAQALGAPAHLLVGPREMEEHRASVRLGPDKTVKQLPLDHFLSHPSRLLEQAHEELWRVNRERMRGQLVEVEEFAHLSGLLAEGRTAIMGLCGEQECIARLDQEPAGELIGRMLEPDRPAACCGVCFAKANQTILFGVKYSGEK
ncbi:His/Gly/Thr/Pro-type tRNA ligase C-terminal domain-containing protein [Myxococcus sp. NMCA1]|uniref:His/Gly/Thr/Pro-type tRNA ligase C-terminal domain-containing protein n=1 Tax=Myxococcus sp. NMCA1 TaxID=2996785 RepID=UPI0022867EEB|nr:His/Gly/Thr/Pro-type tRNA ligase C-terminal domain-containing protein [Myxococcus sp. NMCA1]WAM29919.1 His/Gly/Thr/Pro-type tRNA ligase C-terminal domain-containing protein [Myxococcus sp. NMCA1]